MRRVLVATAAVLALSAIFAGGAGAKCGVSCLNRKVKQLSSAVIKAEKTIASLSKTVAAQKQEIAAQKAAIASQGATIAGLSQGAKFVTFLETCLFEAPFTQYGDPNGTFGYLFEEEGGGAPIKRTALDFTAVGDAIDAWFLFNACETQTTLSASGVGDPVAGARALQSTAGNGR